MPPEAMTFALVVPNAPWWNVGAVTQKAAARLGMAIQLKSYPGEELQLAAVCSGEASFGINTRHLVAWAYNGTHAFAGSPHPNMRAIAAVFQPHWFAFAVRYETRITAIEQIPQRKMPLRVFSFRWSPGATPFGISRAYLITEVLAAYGFSMEDIESWGGVILTPEHSPNPQREGHFDVMIGQAYPAYGPVGRRWQEATILHNMRFLPLRSDILEQLSTRLGVEKGMLPNTLFRGVDRDIPTLYTAANAIYTNDEMPEQTIYEVTRALDEYSDYFLERYVTFSYHPFKACINTGAPLHPGAERYYREKGYLR